jgi:hypothetical protein
MVINPPSKYKYARVRFENNATALNLTQKEYFNKIDFHMLELPTDPTYWTEEDWSAFHDAMEYDEHIIFLRKNNL